MMPKPRDTRVRFWLALLLVAGLVAASLPALADPNQKLQDIERRKQQNEQRIERAEDRKRDLLHKIRIVDDERSTAENQVASLDQELAVLSGRIEQVEARLTRAQQQLTILETELSRILKRLVRRNEIFEARAVATYKAGPTSYLESILSSDTFSEVLDRYSYYESALTSDHTLLEEIETLRAQTDARRREVETKKEEIALAKKGLEEDRARVAAIRDQKAGALAMLEGALVEKEVLLSRVEERKQRWQSAQRQLDSESQRIQDLLAARSVDPGPSTGGGGGGGGQFAWPAPGPVTSPYGYRTHPIFGDRRLHTGVDIGAGYGATVISAAAGTVAYVGVMSGYGNVVVVDHGGGVATTYNHLSSFAVGSGASVGRGTPVGAVGCTGYCTGPHLHFEVRVNGSPVDPMPYLN